MLDRYRILWIPFWIFDYSFAKITTKLNICVFHVEINVFR